MEEKFKQTNPTLHKYLFTVTTFSKLLAMFLFVLLPFVGFYLGMKYQEKITNQNPEAFQLEKKSAETKTKESLSKTVNPSKTIGYASNITFKLVNTAGWKTFSNGMFTFKYPKEYSIESKNDTSLILSKIVIGKGPSGENMNFTTKINIEYSALPQDINTKEDLFRIKYPVMKNQNPQDMINMWTKATSLDDVDAYYFITAGSGSNFGDGIMAIHKDLTYVIRGEGYSMDINNDKVELQTLVSTFKFTN